MAMSERKEHWEAVYRNKSPLEVSWYQQEPTLSFSLINGVSVPLDAPVIDIGGGASTLVDKLSDAGFTNISVLDVSGAALAHAKQRLAHKSSAVRWYEEDVTSFEPPHRFLLWHDRAVFHFLTRSEDRKNYVDVLERSLLPGGHIIIMTFAIGGPEKCSGLDIVQYDADKLTTELGAGFELLETGFEVHLTPSGNQQKFVYFRLVKSRDSIK
jgi:SAM-dependent methyltransferase